VRVEERVERYYGILLSGFLSLILGGLFTLSSLGLTRAWLLAWATAFVVGWMLAVGLVALFGSRIRGLAVALAQKKQS